MQPGNKSLIGALPLVAKALSDNYGVSLAIRGSQAYAKENCIVLPVLPEDDRRAAILARGYLDHEAGHIKHTEIGVQGENALESNLLNILEDIRVEQAMGRRYPGCRQNLAKLMELLAAEGDTKPLTAGASIPATLLGYVWTMLRAKVLGQEVFFRPEWLPQAEAVFDQAFPTLRSRVEQEALAIGTAPDTKTALAIARRILRLVSDQGNQAGKSPRTQEKGDRTNSEVREDQGKEEGQPGVEASESSETDASAPPAEEVHNPTLEPSESAPAGHQAALDDACSATAACATAAPDAESCLDIGQILAAKLGELSVGAIHRDSITMAKELPPWWDQRPVNLTETMAATARLRAMLSGVVQSRRACRSRPTRQGTKLNVRALSKLTIKDGRVFLSREERSAVNTAVYLLLDQSASMSRERRFMIAFQTTIALVRALRGIPGVAVGVGSFTTTKNICDSVVVPLLRFGQSERCLTTAPPPWGNTPMAEAVIYTAGQLLMRREPRKMLVVITDGQPDDYIATQESIKRCRASGLEAYGVGIELDLVEPLFGRANAVVIKQIGELPEKLFRLLAQKL